MHKTIKKQKILKKHIYSYCFFYKSMLYYSYNSYFHPKESYTMNKITKKTGPKPQKSLFLYEQIKHDIKQGKYGNKLPGMTALSQNYNACPATIQRVIHSLAQEAVLEIIPRSGTYVKNTKDICFLVFFEPADAQQENTPPIGFIAEYESLYNGIHSAAKEADARLIFQLLGINDSELVSSTLGKYDRIITLYPQNLQQEIYKLFEHKSWIRVMGPQDYNSLGGHITYDNYKIGKIAADFLLKRKCTKFAYVGSKKMLLFRQRFDSFEDALGDHKFSATHLMADTRNMSAAEVSANIHEFCLLHLEEIKNGELGIFCGADHFLLAIRQELSRLGIDATKVNLISCDNNSYYLKGIYPESVEIDIRMFDIGRRAVNIALDPNININTKEAITPKLIIPDYLQK